ncbi:hypothetical protein ACIQM3_07180 [Streptomyces sp. NPDC091271]|uniref:hypothetical protein n=1 Tax=Streptomyces sp. NPDC091271 TaxID=3365980 RepID=UPI0038123786
MGDQALAPVPEGDSGLALPVDLGNEVAQLLRRVADRGPCLQQRLAGLFEVLRVGVLDQVDHHVEVDALEGRATRGAGAPEAERLHHALHLARHVRDDQLTLDALRVLLLLLSGRQFRLLLLVTHQLSPKSS